MEEGFWKISENIIGLKKTYRKIVFTISEISQFADSQCKRIFLVYCTEQDVFLHLPSSMILKTKMNCSYIFFKWEHQLFRT